MQPQNVFAYLVQNTITVCFTKENNKLYTIASENLILSSPIFPV